MARAAMAGLFSEHMNLRVAALMLIGILIFTLVRTRPVLVQHPHMRQAVAPSPTES